MIKKGFRMRLNSFLLYSKNYFFFYLYRCLPTYFYYFKVSNLNNNIYLYTSSKNFFFLSFFLKNSYIAQFNSLTDLVIIDNYSFKKRFKLVYNFLSIFFNKRAFVIVFLDENKPFISSLVSLFKSSN